MENNTICLIKDNEFKVVCATTDWGVASEILANAHNEALVNGATADIEDDFSDSLSGYHCSIWSGSGKVLAIYGEDGSILCEERELTAEEIVDDMFSVLSMRNF